MNKLSFLLLGAMLLAAAMGSPVAAAPANSLNASGPVASSPNVSVLNVPDPHKQLRHLSKNLKLNKDQRAGVSIILEERTREMHLLIDIDSLSQEYRDSLAAKVIEVSDAQIAALLRNKQKRKFEELSKTQEMHQ